jgi:caffeoyl-CoA O-methyltransferase
MSNYSFVLTKKKERCRESRSSFFRLANPGAIIVGDNALRGGKVFDEAEQDENTLALRACNEKIAKDERVESLLIPIGDGLAVARVK